MNDLESKAEIKDRLKEIINDEGLNVKRFSEKIGASHTGIYNIVDGTSKPGFEILEKIIKTFPQYNETWIILGTGKKKKDNNLFSSDISFGERIINEISGLKEQLAIKDKQIDKLLDIVSLVGKADVSKQEAPVNEENEIVLDSKIRPLNSKKSTLLTGLLTLSANS